MKILKLKSLIALFIVVFVLLICTSCNGGKDSNNTSNNDSNLSDSTYDPTGSVLNLSNGKYTIIRSDNSSKIITDASSNLRNLISEKFNTELGISTDWYPDGTYGNFEILIGDTNRSQSIDAKIELLYDDYTITLNGDRLVIIGGSDDATAAAVEKFIQLYVENEMGSSLEFNKDKIYKYDKPYRINSFLINGNEISKYQIVYKYSSSIVYQEEAKRIAEFICDRSGIMLPVVSDLTAEKEYEILIGNTNRSNASSEDLSATQYIIFIESNKVFVNCNSYWACSEAVTSFYNNINQGLGTFELTFDGTVTDFEAYAKTIRATGSDIRVMSTNVLFVSDTSKYNTSQRMDILGETYLMYLPDAIATQEFSNECRNLIMSKLSPYYAEAPSNSTYSNFTAILYLKDKYDVVDSGYERFTPNSYTKSIGWAVLRDKLSGKMFAVTSAHYSLHPADGNVAVGNSYREDNSRQLLALIDKLKEKHGDIAITCGGDYFYGKTSNSYKILIDGGLSDSAETATLASMPNTRTHHELGEVNKTGTGIDLVLYTPNTLQALKHHISVSNYYVNYASDHSLIISDFKFK